LLQGSFRAITQREKWDITKKYPLFKVSPPLHGSAATWNLWHLFSGAQQLGFFQLRQITEEQQTWKGNVGFLGLELFPETSKDDGDDDDDDDDDVVVDDTDTVGQCQQPHGLVWMIVNKHPRPPFSGAISFWRSVPSFS